MIEKRTKEGFIYFELTDKEKKEKGKQLDSLIKRMKQAIKPKRRGI